MRWVEGLNFSTGGGGELAATGAKRFSAGCSGGGGGDGDGGFGRLTLHSNSKLSSPRCSTVMVSLCTRADSYVFAASRAAILMSCLFIVGPATVVKKE